MENKEMTGLFTTVLPASSMPFDECEDRVKHKRVYGDRGDLSGRVIMSLTAENIQVGLPMDVTARLDCYGDKTCRLALEVAQFGVELDADQGTYHVSGTNRFTFHFQNAGEVTGEPDYASAAEGRIEVAAYYRAKLEERFNSSKIVLSIDARLKGTYVTGSITMAG